MYKGFEKNPPPCLSSGMTTIFGSPLVAMVAGAATAGAPQSGHLGQAAHAGHAGQATVTGATALVTAGLVSDAGVSDINSGINNVRNFQKWV